MGFLQRLLELIQPVKPRSEFFPWVIGWGAVPGPQKKVKVSFQTLNRIRHEHAWVNACLNAIKKQVIKAEWVVEPIDPRKPFNEETQKNIIKFFESIKGGEKELRAKVVDSKKTFGDGWIEITEDSNHTPTGLFYVPAESMRINANVHGQVTSYSQVISGEETAFFTPAQIIHLKEKYDEYSLYGRSDLESLLFSLSMDLAADETNAKLILNEATPPGIVNVQNLPDEEVSRLKALMVQELNQNPNRPIIMNGQVQWIPFGNTMKEMNWTEFQREVRNKIMAVFGVLPIQISVVETGKLANPEQQLEISDEYIMSELQQLEQVYNERVVKKFPGSENLRFVFKELDKKQDWLKKEADILLTKANAAKTLASIPESFTKDEVRSIVGLPPIAEGKAFVPTPAPMGLSLKDVEGALVGVPASTREETRDFFRELNLEYRKAAQAAVKEGKRLYEEPNPVKALGLSEWRKKLEKVIAPFSPAIAAIIIEQSEDAFKKGWAASGAGITLSFDQKDENAIRIITHRRNGALQQFLSQEWTRKQADGFAQVLHQSFEKGLSLPDMVKAMQAHADVEEFRLERIARSETTRIANEGRAESWKELEKERGEKFTYEWSIVDDDRTSEICFSIAAGNPYSLEELREVTDNFLPHPNCRSTMTRFVE